MTPPARSRYQPVIGLEVHIQLLTASKAFSSDAATYGGAPNAQVSVVSLGHPGTLPRPNRRALELAVRLALACQCAITRHNTFARKNYFYPDLPKGYQLTQDKNPLGVGGQLWIRPKAGGERAVPLTRIHAEEDAGKLLHLEPDTRVDYNRAGVPLVELVTQPALHSADEVHAFLTEVRKLVRYLGICDGNMEEGSLRADVNVSLRPVGSAALGTKVEIKNLNSIRNAQRAVEYEIDRQAAVLDAGGQVLMETRTFDADAGQTRGTRAKETMNDYRYFPEPDLSPVVFSETWLASIHAALPTLPRARFAQFTGPYGLSDYDATALTDTPEMADYFGQLCTHTTHYKAAANWLMGPVRAYLNEHHLTADAFPVTPAQLADLIALVEDGKLSHSAAAQQVLPRLVGAPHQTPLQIAQALQLTQPTNARALAAVVDEVLAAHPQKVLEYRKGKRGLLQLFVGEVMKQTKGQADPQRTQVLLAEALEK